MSACLVLKFRLKTKPSSRTRPERDSNANWRHPMPQKLKLALLGPPQVWLDDEPVTLSHNSKTQALLYFLDVTNQTWPRPSLAELLWGDMADEAARVNLSKALTELRQVLDDLVIVDRQQV